MPAAGPGAVDLDREAMLLDQVTGNTFGNRGTTDIAKANEENTGTHEGRFSRTYTLPKGYLTP